MSKISIENRKRLQDLLVDLKSFVGFRVHSLFVSQTKRQLEEVSEILLDPETRDHAVIMELKGQRSILLSNINLFEDAVDNLENQIQKLLDEENETPQN